MKIIFPHIPKCAGVSIRSQLEKRDDLYLDYFNHPTWACAEDREQGSKQQQALKDKISRLDAWIVYGHFPPHVYYDLPYDLQIIIIREPLDRAISHFHFVRDLLPDNEITRRRHTEVAAIKEHRMGIEEFVELDHVRYFYSKYYLGNLCLDERLVATAMENMASACNRIMEVSGIKLDPAVWINRSNHSGSYDHLAKYFRDDTELYKRLTGQV